MASSRAGATGNCSASPATSATASIPGLSCSTAGPGCTPAPAARGRLNDTEMGRRRSAAASAARLEQEGHHRPEGPVGPGRWPLRLVDHHRRHPSPQRKHLADPWVLGSEHAGSESHAALHGLLQLRRRLLDRDYVLNGTGTQVGYGNYSADMSGCGIEPSFPRQRRREPGGRSHRATAEAARATTRTCRSSPPATGTTFIAGPKGRLRQGIQYSLIRRDLWSGAPGTGTANPGGGAHGDDNMIFTSFRYYLP
jgi:hypothetical protein